MTGFRSIKQGPVVVWTHNRWFSLTVRLRRQRIDGQARSGFVDLVVGQRIVFGALGRRLWRGKFAPRNGATYIVGAKFGAA